MKQPILYSQTQSGHLDKRGQLILSPLFIFSFISKLPLQNIISHFSFQPRFQTFMEEWFITQYYVFPNFSYFRPPSTQWKSERNRGKETSSCITVGCSKILWLIGEVLYFRYNMVQTKSLQHFSRPGRSQGLLYIQPHDSLIDYLINCLSDTAQYREPCQISICDAIYVNL